MRVTRAQLEEALAETNWKALDALTDRDIARAVAQDPDAAPIMTATETSTTRRASGAKAAVGRRFVLDLSGGRIFSASPDGSYKTILVADCHWPDGL